MPVRVEKRKGKYVVTDGGKTKKGRTHASKKKAVAQVRAINKSLGYW